MSPMRLRDLPDDVNEISGSVLDAAIEVHRALGPGLLESAYRSCLAHELRLRGHDVASETPIPLTYKGLIAPLAYRADLIVAGKILIEIKAVSDIDPVMEAQLLTYLRLTGIELGFLLNFHAPRMRDGFRRMVLRSDRVPS